MKQLSIHLAAIFLFSISSFAQSRPDYSGEWTLDKSKMNSSALPNIESITIKAVQIASDFKIDVSTKFPLQSEEFSENDGTQSKRVRRPLLDGTTVYSLGGEETVVQIDSPAGKLPLRTQANFANDGKLNLKTIRVLKTPNGEIELIIQELWELAEDGKTLKIAREVTAPNGSNKVEMVFTKK